MPAPQRETENGFAAAVPCPAEGFAEVLSSGERVTPSCLSQPAMTNSAGAAVFLNDSREVMACKPQLWLDNKYLNHSLRSISSRSS